MRLFKTHSIYTLIVVLIIGLTPLLWFTPGNFITGTDVDFSPFPQERFFERLNTWNPNLLAGVDRTNNTGSLSYIGTSAFLSLIFKDPILVEKITFVIWFSLVGISMWYFVRSSFLDFEYKRRVYLEILAPLMYMINFYNMFLWVRLQLNVTTMVFVPILFSVLYQIVLNNKLTSKMLLLGSVGIILGGSLGIQPPLIYVLIIATAVFTLYFFSFDLSNLSVLSQKVRKLIVFGVVLLFSGAYWIFPLSNFIFNSNLASQDSVGRETYNVESLLAWTSSHTSYLNVLRMYGDVVWFDGWGGTDYFPEFLAFINNPLTTIFSYILVCFVFISVFSAANYNSSIKKLILSLALVFLVLTFFAKGTHPPFDFLFGWFFNNLPGFWIHRAPWQKFGLVIAFCIAVLGSVGSEAVLNWLNKKTKVAKWLLLSLLVNLYLFYHMLFVFGLMFPHKNSQVGYHGVYDLGFHHNFPEYIYETRNYFLNLDTENFNVLLLPESYTNVYNWGFAGSADIVSMFINRSTLFTPYGEGFVLNGLITNVYSDIAKILYSDVDIDLGSAFNMYNINYILQRNDFRFGFFGDSDSPEFIAESLQNHGINNKTTFGDWDLYVLEENETNDMLFTVANHIDVTDLKSNILLPVFQKGENYVLYSQNKVEIPTNATYISLDFPSIDAENLASSDFDGLDGTLSFDVMSEASVPPYSVLYRAVLVKETMVELLEPDPAQKLSVKLWHSLKRLNELQKYKDLDAEQQSQVSHLFTKKLLSFKMTFYEYEGLLSSEDKVSLLSSAIAHIELAENTIGVTDEFTSSSLEEIRALKKKFMGELDPNSCTDYCNKILVNNSGSYEIRVFFDDYSNALTSNRHVTLVNEMNEEAVVSGSMTESSVFLENGKYKVYTPWLQPRVYSPESFQCLLSSTLQDLASRGAPDIDKSIDMRSVSYARKVEFDLPQDVSTYDFILNYTLKNVQAGVFMLFQDPIDQANNTTLVEHRLLSNRDLGSACQLSNGTTKCVLRIKGGDLSQEYRRLTMYIYALPQDDSLKHVFAFKNPRLEQTQTPNLVLYKTSQLPVQMSPGIIYKQLSPTKFAVHFPTGVETPFSLVLNQSYSPAWQVYKFKDKFPSLDTSYNSVNSDTRIQKIRSFFYKPLQTFRKDQLPEQSHFIANHYANGWYITPEDLDGIGYLVIEFSPQKTLYFSLLSTLLIPCILMLYIGYIYVVKWINKR